MKKKLLSRCLIGGLGGFAISFLIGVRISLSIGDGLFHGVPLTLVEQCGNELTATIVQAVCSFIYGAAWAGSSVVWEMESWSILRQTVTHMLVVSITSLPIAYLMHWVPHTVMAVVLYFVAFFLIYFVIWLICYTSWRKKIRQMNEKLN